MSNLLDFNWYSRNALKIQTKTGGFLPFILRIYQLKYLQHLKDDFPDGIIRSLSLKPRQAGWSTLIGGKNFHSTATRHSYNGIVMADKSGRTQAVHGIYSRYLEHMPARLRPMVAKNNEEQILFDNPNKDLRLQFPGLSSGFISETAQDPNAGKSSSRQWAHLSEYAFYPYASEIDTSVQNSIPLARGTAIFKESTANGMSGDGESFYQQWEAAVRGDYLYKPWFVAWYEIDDYQLPVPRDFIITSEEKDLLLRCPSMTLENLAWRRMKIKETMTDPDLAMKPEELFKQDYPSFPEEAFLSSGRPVFDNNKLKADIHSLLTYPSKEIKTNVKKETLSKYPTMLTIWETPIKGEKYVIGADVAEGLESGDASSAKIINSNAVEVARFHGRLDPDEYGKVLVELAETYNKALIVPEVNNMGHTTLQAIKEKGYLNVYMREVQDEISTEKKTSKMGWQTNVKTKQTMLNRLVAYYRDGLVKIRDIEVLREMLKLTRGSDGSVELNGRDRVVGLCLALMGLDQLVETVGVFNPNKTIPKQTDTRDESRASVLQQRRRNEYK